MARILLQNMVDDFRFDDLPINWNSFDLEGFSRDKRLWDYQQKAVENALKVLWKYFEDFVDYQQGEKLEVSQERKRKFFKWYMDSGQDGDLDINLNKANRSISNLLTEYYPQQNGKISYEYFINRMCFWMATGSGKTLVLVKLIQILHSLIRFGEIPSYDILVLTHRDDLIEQLKRHINEFNSGHSNIFIGVKELKEYPSSKWENHSLFEEREATVFYYRSDNLSDEQKERIIDFKNYNNDGKWYIFLDEAHKGDKEDSKRQHIYSILSRCGFLFNFSATFTDPRDIITTACNFNLERFINSGYGKHISVLTQEIRAFKDNEDYDNEEKKKVVLKSFIILAYIKKFYEDLRNTRTKYHKPLLLTLVNSVNKEDADLKLFFRELKRVGKGEISSYVWHQAKNELWDELKEGLSFIFEDDCIKTDERIFRDLSKEDVLHHLFNSNSSGEIEILVRPSNRQELAFKLKTSDRPFALIKIGDISGWLKDELVGYEINERFDDESYFENLNREDSEINILMGSRSFYEGWDSNRPNIINFINIGIGADAKKFILQSIGRGVRIEPLENERRRLLKLYNADRIHEDLFNQLKDKVPPIETLFVFGTNRNALVTVIEELKKERGDEAQLSLFINEDARKYKLLIPTYKSSSNALIENRGLSKFEVSQDNIDLLKKYVDFISDSRVMLAIYDTEPEKLKALMNALHLPDDYFKPNGRTVKNLNLLVRRILDYFSVIPEEFEYLKELEDEIKHFKQIKVTLKDINDLKSKVDKVRNYPALKEELETQYGKMPADEYMEKAKNLSGTEQFDSNGKRIQIKYIANHYYVPTILSEGEKLDYIKHIIKTPSEVAFINDLERYLAKSDNKFKEFEWLFSKLDETLDEVYIPYYNPNTNKINRFYPDFIFWLKKKDNYFIIFADPKGLKHTDWTHKVDGYKQLFEEDGKEKIFKYDGLNARIKLLLRTDDITKAPDDYRRFWFDSLSKMLDVAK